MAELKLGYKASAEQFAPRELVELAVEAEAHGMDSATVSDHFQPWRHEGGHAPFSLAWMTAVGERTKRLVLGTSVLTPTFRYNPAVIAQAFATMGCLYPDRIFLGVGTGEALNEIATGYEGEWPEFKERYARLRESIKLMRELWLGDRVDFDGEYYKTKGASIYDVPDGGIPIYIAAGGPQVAKYAGRAGDGFICTSGKGEELYKDKLIPAVKEGAEAAGKSPDAIDRMIEIKISYDTDPEAGLGEHPVLGAAVADRGAEDVHPRPDRDGEGRRRAAHRAGRQALDRGLGPGRGRREGQGLRRLGSQSPGLPRPRPRPAALPRTVPARPGAAAAQARLALSPAEAEQPQLDQIGAARDASGGRETRRHTLRACGHGHRLVHLGPQSCGRELLARAVGCRTEPPRSRRATSNWSRPKGTAQTGTPRASAFCVAPIPPWVTAHTARSNTMPCGTNRRTVALAGVARISSGCPAGRVATTCTGSSASAASAVTSSRESACFSDDVVTRTIGRSIAASQSGARAGTWVEHAWPDHLNRLAPFGLRVLERFAAGDQDQLRPAQKLIHRCHLRHADVGANCVDGRQHDALQAADHDLPDRRITHRAQCSG